jgi:hypothetical protein
MAGLLKRVAIAILLRQDAKVSGNLNCAVTEAEWCAAGQSVGGGSASARHLVWGYREAGVSATDDRNRTLRLDAYLEKQKENPTFATSLVPERQGESRN